MNETRTFRCQIDEGTYSGEVSVSVDAETVERLGNKAIEDAAWCEWWRQTGSPIGMAYKCCSILEEIE
jgi:hypothetical protein